MLKNIGTLCYAIPADHCKSYAPCGVGVYLSPDLVVGSSPSKVPYTFIFDSSQFGTDPISDTLPTHMIFVGTLPDGPDQFSLNPANVFRGVPAIDINPDDAWVQLVSEISFIASDHRRTQEPSALLWQESHGRLTRFHLVPTEITFRF